MSNVALPLKRVSGRVSRQTLMIAGLIIVVALMALSFAVGRATGDTNSVTPARHPAISLPIHAGTPELGCSHPGRC